MYATPGDKFYRSSYCEQQIDAGVGRSGNEAFVEYSEPIASQLPSCLGERSRLICRLGKIKANAITVFPRIGAAAFIHFVGHFWYSDYSRTVATIQARRFI